MGVKNMKRIGITVCLLIFTPIATVAMGGRGTANSAGMFGELGTERNGFFVQRDDERIRTAEDNLGVTASNDISSCVREFFGAGESAR
jgi:hypothetical protein